MEVKELGHLVLYVRDITNSVHFYRDVLGWRQILPTQDQQLLGKVRYAAFNSMANRTHHELLLIEVGADAASIPQGRRVGLYHFGLKVGNSDEELRDVHQRLLASKTPILGATDHTVTHSLYLSDPDGNEIELYIDVPGVDWKSDPTLIGAPPKPLRL